MEHLSGSRALSLAEITRLDSNDLQIGRRGMATTDWTGNSGDWGDASNWSDGVPNDPSAVADLAGTGAYTVSLADGEAFTVGTLNITDPSAVFSPLGKLTVAGAISLDAGTLTATGTISGGTLKLNGGNVVYENGTFDNMTVWGPIDVGTGGTLGVTNGLTVRDASGNAPGTVNMTSGSQLVFYGNQTFDNAAVNIGGTLGTTSAYIYVADGNGSNATLTLGPNVNLDSTGARVFVEGSSDATLFNQGTITAEVEDGQFNVTTVSFANTGTINVENSDTFVIDTPAFSNTGTINVTTGAVLDLNGNLTGTGLGTIAVNGGAAVLGGTLDNSGNVLRVGGSNPLSQLMLTGTIQSGTIVDGGSGIAFGGGALDGVEYDGTMTLGGTVDIYDGITLKNAAGAGNGAVKVTGNGSELNFYGTQTVNNATITLGSAGNAAYLGAIGASTPTDTLTLGAGLTIDVAGGQVNFGFAAGGTAADFVNNGTINAGVSGGQLSTYAAGFTNAGTINLKNRQIFLVRSLAFKNSGTINVTGGATLDLAPNLDTAALGTIVVSSGGVVELDGALDNSGATLSVGTNYALSRVTLDGTIGSGTIVDGGNGIAFNNGTLDGVTYEGTMRLNTANAKANIYDGITLTGAGGVGSGTVNVTGASAELNFVGTQTVDNARINLGNSSSSDSLTATPATATSTLTLGTNLTIANVGLDVSVGGGKIVNKGKITAATANGAFFIGGTDFSNSGTITAANGESLTITGPFENTGKVIVTNGATLHLSGTIAGAELGTINAKGGAVAIDGTLDDSGHVLKVGGTNPLGQVTLDGAIQSGTIVDAGSGFNFANGQLHSVKYEGTLALDGDNQRLSIYDGITLTGAGGTGKGEIDITGPAAELDIYGNETLNNATVMLGAAGQDYGLLNAYSTAIPSTLTFGAGLTLIGSNANAQIGGNAKLVNKGTIIADSDGGRLFVETIPMTNAGAPALTNSGALIVAGGASMEIGPAVVNTGAAEVIDGTLAFDNAVTGTGSLQIDSAGTLSIGRAIGTGQSVSFNGRGGTLVISTPDAFAASIYGFGSGDVLDNGDIVFGSKTTVSFSGNTEGGTLTVSDGVHTAKLNLVGDFIGGTFSDAVDDSGGTIVTFSDAASAAAQSRLHQFMSAVATHSADKGSLAGVQASMADVAADRNLLAASAHH
jgi:hypothetical protein